MKKTLCTHNQGLEVPELELILTPSLQGHGLAFMVPKGVGTGKVQRTLQKKWKDFKA